jgi:galactokinase
LKFYFPQLQDRKKSNVTNCKFKKEDKWANALKAVIVGFAECGFPSKGLNITVWSDVQPNTGFGIKNAMKVAMALIVKNLFYENCEDSVLLQAIERGNKFFLNVGNYLSDIYTCLYSDENSCVLTDYLKNTYTSVPFNFDDYSILLINQVIFLLFHHQNMEHLLIFYQIIFHVARLRGLYPG